MKIVVLDADTLGKDLDLSPFSELGEVYIYNTTLPEQVEQRLADCDVAVLNKVKVSEENLKGAKNLKLICITATGYDNVNLEDCRKLNIAVCNVSGYSTDSVAQTTIALALSLIMHIPFYDKYVKNGEYTKSGVANCLSPVFCELNKKTWGIVGYGNIGAKTAEIAKAMGCEILAYSRSKKQGVNCVSLDELLEKSDIVSLHLPLSNETRGIIGKKELEKMKKTAVLVNVARGALTDEATVAEAIKNGEIAAFGTDVYSIEPIREENPLFKIMDRENVIFTPHLAWGAYEARERCRDEVILNIKDFFDGGKRNRLV